MSSAINIPKFERFFRTVASLDVDHNDVKRYNDFINTRINDLLVRAEAIARANSRDVIEPHDLPIGKGLQERIQEFQRLDEDIQLEPILDHITSIPTLDLSTSVETDEFLPDVAGGLSVALARSFTLIDTTLRNPSSVHWERAFSLFNLII